jgi:hypothetical protein
MMLRDPRLRLYSAYHYGMHAFGLNVPHVELERAVSSVHDFVRYPGIQGCQVKMLNGLYCAQLFDITTAMVNRAIERVERSAFFGITDEWNDSMCLFSAMYGGRTPDAVFRNVRSTAETDAHYRRELGLSEIKKEDDPHDWRLFEAALIIFRRRQKLYGVPAFLG